MPPRTTMSGSHSIDGRPSKHAPRATVPWAQFARGHRVERLFENFDGRWTCEWGVRHVRADKTAKVGPVGAHPLSRGTTRTLAGSVLERGSSIDPLRQLQIRKTP